MKLFAQIRKVDEAKRLVYGRAAEEAVDKSGEIMDYASSKPNFEKWSADIAADSGGANLGNVRAMHGKVAAGKLTGIDFSDADKAVDVCAKVVDDNEWKKVLEGVYTGFSIGGSYANRKVEKIDSQDVTRYTAVPTEISLVDRPCMKGAKFFDVQKADGTLAKVEFVAPAEPEPIDVRGTPEQVIELGKLMNEGGLELADVLKAMPDFIAAKKKKAAAKDGDAAKDDDDEAAKKKAADAEAAKKAAEAGALQKLEGAGALRKGVYDCQSFASVLGSLLSLQRSAAYEAFQEGDDSALPKKIGAIIAMVGEVFKQLIDECIGENAAGAPALLAMAEQAQGLMKAEGAAFAKLDTDPLLALLKAGARNSASDKDRIGKIHALTVELGHECAGEAAKMAKVAAARELLKASVADPESLAGKTDDEIIKLADALPKASEAKFEKLLADAVAPLQKALDESKVEIDKLKAQPAPARVSLRAIAKNADVLEDPVAKVAEPKAIVDDLGDKHEAAGLIKSLHAAGGVSMTLPAALRS